MSINPCEDVQETLGQGRGLSSELAEHVHSCASCTEALNVATWLRREASQDVPRSDLPSASHLWWRARIIRDLTANESLIEQATRSTRWMQGLGLGLLGLLIASGLTMLTASLFSGLQTQAAAGSMPWSWLVGLLVVGTIVPLAGFTALWTLWREA